MNETLHDINLSEQLSNKSTEESWNCLAENLTKLTEKYIPVNKTSLSYSKPPVDAAAIQAIRNKRTKWVKYVNCKNIYTYNNYQQARNKVTYELRRTKWKYERDLQSR